MTTMLSVRDGAKAVRFYEEAFGAEVLFRMQNGDDAESVGIAQLAFAGRDFWVAEEAPAYGTYSPESLDGKVTARMVLVVDDPDALYARAMAAGGREICPVRDEEYGWRIGVLVDPCGQRWEIGRPL